MKYLLTFLLMLVAGTSVADSGVYYNPLKNGEGIITMIDGERYLFYVFTYGALGCYEDDVKPENSNGPECDINGQRWFFGDGVFNPLDMNVVGTLYMAHGIDYPVGEKHQTEPFVHNVGETIPVGLYELRPTLTGFDLDVVQAGEALDEDDPLFKEIFNFDKLLFEVDEGE